MRGFFVLLFLLLLPTADAMAHGSAVVSADMALEEKLGQTIPPDAQFVDEAGRKVNLRDLIDKPTIIAPVYLGCRHECPMLLAGLGQALGKLERMTPGKDFNVLTLSFDNSDTPAIALDRKRNYLKAIGKPFPEPAWKFLTGDSANIRKFTDAIGFRFQRDGEHDFSHPLTLVVLAPGGRIVRYLEGVSFLPFEVSMALTEAAEGKVGSAARKAMMYCFSYDPLKKSYVFNILKVTGTVMVLFVAGFLAYLMLSTKKKRGAS